MPLLWRRIYPGRGLKVGNAVGQRTAYTYENMHNSEYSRYQALAAQKHHPLTLGTNRTSIRFYGTNYTTGESNGRLFA